MQRTNGEMRCMLMSVVEADAEIASAACCRASKVNSTKLQASRMRFCEVVADETLAAFLPPSQ